LNLIALDVWELHLKGYAKGSTFQISIMGGVGAKNQKVPNV